MISLMTCIAFAAAVHAQTERTIRRAADPIPDQYIVVLDDVPAHRVAEVAVEMVLRSEGAPAGNREQRD